MSLGEQYSNDKYFVSESSGSGDVVLIKLFRTILSTGSSFRLYCEPTLSQF